MSQWRSRSLGLYLERSFFTPYWIRLDPRGFRVVIGQLDDSSEDKGELKNIINGSDTLACEDFLIARYIERFNIYQRNTDAAWSQFSPMYSHVNKCIRFRYIGNSENIPFYLHAIMINNWLLSYRVPTMTKDQYCYILNGKR